MQAEKDALFAVVGADQPVFARSKPFIESWAATLVHIGVVGDGHRIKLLHNFLSLGYATMCSEAMALGAKMGIDAKRFDSVICGSRMDCGFYQTFIDYALDGNRKAHKFTMTNGLKDLRYLESTANEASIANPIGNAAKSNSARDMTTGGDGPRGLCAPFGRFYGV